MHAVPEEVARQRSASSGPGLPAQYDAFLSYTHEDRPAAAAVQRALHRIGRRFGQLRALHIFRDDTNLEASPDLWGKIAGALDQARFMVVLLSPHAATSKWVNNEIAYWLEQRGTQPLMVLVAGNLHWNEVEKCFDAAESNAAPPVLTVPGSLPVEPFFLNLTSDGPPWSASAPGFRDRMTALAAPLHGKPKDQLAGDDLREQRRVRRLRTVAIAALTLLTIVATVAGSVAFVQRRAAIEQRDEAVAARLTAESRAMLDDSNSGNDVQALQELLAARDITEHPDQGALYNAVVAKASLTKIVDTGAPAYGGAMSPDGKRIVTGGAAATVRIWDLDTGRPVAAPLQGHTDLIAGVAWSSDGHTIATASADKTIRLWNAESGQAIGRPGVHDGTVLAVAFSPDGQLVASASADSTVRLWRVSSSGPIPIATLAGHVGEVRAVAFSPDGTRLASVGTDAVVRLWDVATEQPIDRSFEPQFTTFFGVSWSPDNRTLATAGWDGLIRLWNADTGEQLGQLTGHRAAVINTLFTPDGRWVVSGSFDKTVRLWDVASRQQIGDSLTGFDGGVAVNISKDHIAAVSNDHTIRILDLLAGQPFGIHPNVIGGIAFSPDQDRLVSGSWDGTVALWEPSTKALIGILPGNTGPVTAVLFGPGGRVAASRATGSVDIWDTGDTSRPPRTLLPCPPNGLALSPDSNVLAVSCGLKGSVQLWRLDRDAVPVEIRDPRGPVGAVAFSPDGRRFASTSGKTIQLWDTENHQSIGEAFAGHDEFVTALSFGPHGDRLLSAAGDNTIRLWDTATGEALSVTPPEGNTVTAIDFSSDGEHLVSGSVDGTVRLWSVSGDQIQPIGSPLRGHAGMVTATEFSSKGDYFISSSADRAMRTWPVAVTVDDVCQKLTANMTPDQWRTWVSAEIPYQKSCPDL